VVHLGLPSGCSGSIAMWLQQIATAALIAILAIVTPGEYVAGSILDCVAGASAPAAGRADSPQLASSLT